MTKNNNNILGIIWMIIHCFVVAIITLATREASVGYSIYMTSALVYAIAFPTTFLYFKILKKPILPTKRWKMYLVRATMGLASYITFAYGLKYMTMADVSAIIFTSPLFGVILAILVLKEQATLMRIAVLLLGFCGAMVIIRPDLEFNIVAWVVLMSSFFYAVVHLSIKSLTNTESHGSILFYTQFLMFLISLPMLYIFWQTPTLTQIFWAGVVATSWHASLYSLSKSHSNADAIVVMPFQFMRLVFVVILGIIFFNEPVNIYTIIGAIIILVSAIISTRYEVKKGSSKNIAMALEGE